MDQAIETSIKSILISDAPINKRTTRPIEERVIERKAGVLVEGDVRVEVDTERCAGAIEQLQHGDDLGHVLRLESCLRRHWCRSQHVGVERDDRSNLRVARFLKRSLDVPECWIRCVEVRVLVGAQKRLVSYRHPPAPTPSPSPSPTQNQHRHRQIGKSTKHIESKTMTIVQFCENDVDLDYKVDVAQFRVG